MRAAAYPTEDPEGVKTPEEIAEIFVELALPGETRNGEVIDL